MQVVRWVPYQSSSGHLFRQPQQTFQAPSTQYHAPTQQVQHQQPQGQQVPPRQGLCNKPSACFKCGKEGHYTRECPQNQSAQSAQPSANSRLVKRTVIKKKVPVSRSRQVNFTDAKQILQQEPMMASMFTIDSYLAYVLFDFGASHLFMSMGL